MRVSSSLVRILRQAKTPTPFFPGADLFDYRWEHAWDGAQDLLKTVQAMMRQPISPMVKKILEAIEIELGNELSLWPGQVEPVKKAMNYAVVQLDRSLDRIMRKKDWFKPELIEHGMSPNAVAVLERKWDAISD